MLLGCPGVSRAILLKKPMFFFKFLNMFKQDHCKTTAFSLDPKQNHCKTNACFCWTLSKTIVKPQLFLLTLSKHIVKPSFVLWTLSKNNVKPKLVCWTLSKSTVKRVGIYRRRGGGLGRVGRFGGLLDCVIYCIRVQFPGKAIKNTFPDPGIY